MTKFEINQFYKLKDKEEVWLVPLQRIITFKDEVVIKLTATTWDNQSVFGVICNKVAGTWIPMKGQEIHIGVGQVEKEVSENAGSKLNFIEPYNKPYKSKDSFPNLKDGTYLGKMSGTILTISSQGIHYNFAFDIGVRGFNIAKTAEVIDGYAYIDI